MEKGYKMHTEDSSFLDSIRATIKGIEYLENLGFKSEYHRLDAYEIYFPNNKIISLSDVVMADKIKPILEKIIQEKPEMRFTRVDYKAHEESLFYAEIVKNLNILDDKNKIESKFYIITEKYIEDSTIANDLPDVRLECTIVLYKDSIDSSDLESFKELAQGLENSISDSKVFLDAPVKSKPNLEKKIKARPHKTNFIDPWKIDIPKVGGKKK